jgi:hypothetical protein
MMPHLPHPILLPAWAWSLWLLTMAAPFTYPDALRSDEDDA